MEEFYKKNWNYPDPKTTNPKQQKLQRFFESIPGILTWITLIGMFVFSWLVPVWVAVFIILFDIYWIYRTIYISSYSIMAYKKMKRWKRIDWRYRLEKIFQGETLLEEIREELRELKQESANKNLSRSLTSIMRLTA